MLTEVQRSRKRAWYIANKDKAHAEVKRNHERKRAVMNEAKNQPCVDCGGRFPPGVMDLHHLGDKTFAVGTDGLKVSMKRLLAEIEKCIVLCANCHRERHASS